MPEPWYAMGVGYTGIHVKEDPLGGFIKHIQVSEAERGEGGTRSNTKVAFRANSQEFL